VNRAGWLLLLCFLFISLVAARHGTPGCSRSSPSKSADDEKTGSRSSAGNAARRDVLAPLMAPGDLPPKVKPMALKDENSGVIFYFESDGQTVTAISKEGAILWHRNPVAERGIKGYTKDGKTSWPTIYHAGTPLDWMIKVMAERGEHSEYIAIGLVKEFGLLDKRTGDYTFMGSD